MVTCMNTGCMTRKIWHPTQAHTNVRRRCQVVQRNMQKNRNEATLIREGSPWFNTEPGYLVKGRDRIDTAIRMASRRPHGVLIPEVTSVRRPTQNHQPQMKATNVRVGRMIPKPGMRDPNVSMVTARCASNT